MKKWSILFLVLSLMVFSFSVVKAADKPYTLRFTMTAVPESSAGQAAEVFKETLESLTDEIDVQLFFSGALYPQDQQQEAVSIGLAEMTYATPAVLSQFLPELSMFTAGYLFEDYESMTSVMNGEVGQKIFDKVSEEYNIRPLAALYLGARQLNYRGNKPIYKPEDLEGMIFRMPNASSWVFLGQAMGMNPTPLSLGEVYMALKTGTIDGQDNPMTITKSRGFYEVTSYISLTNHLIDQVWLAINEDFWQELTPELREKVLQAAAEARKANDDMVLAQEKELIDFFKSQGLTIIEPDREAFRERVLNTYLSNEEMISQWDMELFEDITGIDK